MTEDIPTHDDPADTQPEHNDPKLAQRYAVEKARRQELETTTQKLQAIFDTAPNALAVIDRAFKVVEANPRFLRLFEQEVCLGKPLADFLPVKPLQETIQSTEANLGSVEVEISEPVPHSLLVTLAALRDGQGWVLVLHDLTERKRLEGLKDEFINIAAHELRTPLGGVMGFVSVLQEKLEDYEDPVISHISDWILESTERLKMIIDELVEFATAQRNPGEGLHVVDINVDWLLQKSVRYLQKQITAKNITYRFELPSTSLTVRGDQFILSEVVYQLLKNAVIFNKPGGEIIIRVQRVPLAELTLSEQQAIGKYAGQEMTIIEIEDTGIGIPQTDLDKIFDKFYQVKEHLTRDVGGLGLGLTIARQGVEQHNGQLSVTSKLGQGSIFRVVLPPITQLRDISVDSRANVAHQQTLAYAKDMARAVASQLKMRQILGQVETLSTDLTRNLNQLSAAEPGSAIYTDTLGQIRYISEALITLSQGEAK